MSSNLLECVELATGASPVASVIWLHGLGADGNDFVPIVPELHLPPALSVRFVFPHAPIQPVTINNGMRMRAWYDIAGADLNSRADLVGVMRSQAAVEALIEREKSRGFAASKIVLAGFSQGGVVALHTALRHRERLAGVVALSTYIVQADKLAEEAAHANRDVPIFMGHGTLDDIVRYEWGEASRRVLEANGYRVEWRRYNMPHAVCMEEIGDIAAWVKKILGAKV